MSSRSRGSGRRRASRGRSDTHKHKVIVYKDNKDDGNKVICRQAGKAGKRDSGSAEQ